MKSYADYTHFAAADFLHDAEFRAWIRQPGPERDAWWRGLAGTHPHLKPELAQARLLALGLESTWTGFSDAYVEERFERLRTDEAGRPEPVGRVLPLPARRWRRLAVAACLGLLVAAGGGGYVHVFTETVRQTAYGQLQTVALYDGSVVTLNANSRLRLPSRWAWRTTREVWLDGEAYFSVAKQPGPTGFRKFTVHTTRLDVEVLGTRFNVYARPTKTQVLLDEGHVLLRDATTHQTLPLRPGQLVEYVAAVRRPPRQAAPTEVRSLAAYRQNRLLFDDAPLSELAQRFEEVYGLGLLFEGLSFENQHFTGELPVNDLDKAVLILAESFDGQARREPQRIVLVSN
jgi:ferric-dicitrate binding protein FerR (iron transport regulator)